MAKRWSTWSAPTVKIVLDTFKRDRVWRICAAEVVGIDAGPQSE